MMKKVVYFAPVTEVLAVRSEGIICESGTEGSRSGYENLITLDLLDD